jgi:hypothetical protein
MRLAVVVAALVIALYGCSQPTEPERILGEPPPPVIERRPGPRTGPVVVDPPEGLTVADY